MAFEDVPALSTWKMFSETVKLLEGGYMEGGVKRLANIIKSKDSSNIFIFSKQHTLSLEEHKDIVEKYKAFTTWFIGRFFYLLGCERYSKIHDEIIEAQICLMSQISKTQPHVYYALVQEYAKALQMLVEYHKNPISSIILEVFVPQRFQLAESLSLQPLFIEINSVRECVVLMNKTLQFFKYIVPKDILYFSCSDTTYKILDNLIYLVSNGILFEEVFQILIEMLDKVVCDPSDFDYELILKVKTICSIYEQIIYEFYNNKLQLESDKQFENSIILYLKNCNRLKEELSSHTQRLSIFIIMKSLENHGTNSRTPNNQIQEVCAEYVKFPLHNNYEYNSEYNLQNLIIKTIEQRNFRVLHSFKHFLINSVCKNQENKNKIEFKIYDEVGEWTSFHNIILENIKHLKCTETQCSVQEMFDFLNALGDIIKEIILHYKKCYGKQCTLVFFEEYKLFCEMFSKFLEHTKTCSKSCNYQEFLAKFIILTGSKNSTFFYILCYPLLIPLCFKSDTAFPITFTGNTNKDKFTTTVKSLFSYLSKQTVDKLHVVTSMNQYLILLSSGLIEDLNLSNVQKTTTALISFLVKIKETNDDILLTKAIECLPHVITIFGDPNRILYDLYLPLLSSSSKTIRTKVLQIMPTIICISSHNYFKILSKNKVDIFCVKCHIKKKTVDLNDIELFSKQYYNTDVLGIMFNKKKVDFPLIASTILKNILKYLTIGNAQLKIDTLAVLPYASSHIPDLYSRDIVHIWIEAAGDQNRDVRKQFTKIIQATVQNGQKNCVNSATTDEILDIIFATLLRLTKKSLQYSDCDLQETLLMVIEELGFIKHLRISYECVKLLLYFIMVPTSYHPLIAVNKCFKIAKDDETNKMPIYSQYKKEICEVIVHLCCVNQDLVQYTLQESLSKVAMMLGFHSPKEFLSQESHWLLPFFIVKVIQKPQTAQLIEEVANAVELELPDLLCQKYGNIYVHIILDDIPETDGNRCMAYLEQTTQLNGPALRKRNFRVILNELLLNFHEKKDKALSVLKILATEENESNTPSVPDYLQSQFLGILHCFDVKLISEYSRKDQVLLSLADLFRFMEPRHLIPLRYKIIAMLQTIPYRKYPELACEVWDSYLRNCGVDSLGSQLATIFVSILPLMDYCPEKVNNIAKYLLLENQNHLKDNIADLFFVNNPNINAAVMAVIRKYVKLASKTNLKDKISQSLKYLSHEALEVRVHGLKRLKINLEESREELDQMILGYNGIDPVIVEMVDMLTLGCRENEETLKLGCGEVFAELGAIEPSHLPRRYAENNKTFTYFINEDGFIVSALNELIKASQMEKNTTNMDRFAIAIQEILKTYEISPDTKSAKNYLWDQFPDVQKEVMLPLLSSRYKIYQTDSKNYAAPIYNSIHGSTFNSWLYNWACSLISTLPAERKNLLQMCLPSMKQYNKILMHFLPYILLHSILEGSEGSEEKAFVEFDTVIKSFNDETNINEKLLMNGSLPLPGIIATVQHITPEKQKQTECTKVVFLLFDFLDRWMREWQWLYGQGGQTDSNFVKISKFVGRFCKLQLAKCNYQCGEYPRALMCLEDYITKNSAETSVQLPFLSEIYAQLEEADGVSAMERLQKTDPSLEQTILTLEISGKLADAAACYEHMPRPLKLQHIQGLFQCYLDLDKVNTALHFARGVLDMRPEFSNMLIEMQAEPLWRLGQYGQLEDLLQKTNRVDKNSWGVQIGKALLHLKKGERDSFNSVLEVVKKQQVEAFGAASLEEGAYQHGYSYITRLHCLNELQQAEKTIWELLIKPNDKNHAELLMKKLMSEWELRTKVVQQSVRIIEPLFCMRRVVLDLGKNIVNEKAPQAVPFFDNLLGECWLQSAKIASRTGVYQQAYTYMLDAEQFGHPRLFLEKAKLHWLREENEQMLMTLNRGLQVFIPEGVPSQQAIARLNEEQRKIVAEGRLLIATYNNRVCSVDTDVNLAQYKAAYEVFKEWEKSLVCLAQYYDKIFQNYSKEDKDVCGSDMQLLMVNYFGKSLAYGTKYIYQSIPRLLSIWFDYGTRLLDVTSSTVKEERKTTLLKMTKLIDHFLEKLPPYTFLTAFSQIISRICHPQKEVYGELKSIIIKLLQYYPQQCMWMIISVIKSGYQVRSKRCAEILCDPRLKTTMMMKLVKDFTALAEKLIELCNKEIPPDLNSTSVSSLLRALPRLLSKEDFSEIMMPTHKFRKLILPNPDFKNSEHNPFPNHYAHIVGIEDELSVLNSLQRPRKITLKGSDGKKYIFMLKPKDDLRKDFRLMEFNDTVNLLLIREPEARQRRLNIRLYSVAPLNEECGLIEWVPNLVGLRPVLMALFKQRGLGMKAKEIRENQANLKDPLAKKREIFTKVFLARHPPVLVEWFRKTFPDAQTWLTARTAYIRTTAVMSIAGYILGLGDRHGENISLDSTCGDVVHVDFNCLFNKGESFEWPEKVPFRLTQNMVSAMGPLGVEGIFRKSCELTLKVLRSNSNTLMSIVTPFVYDPLVSWPRNNPVSSIANAEKTNEQAVEHIKNINLRLQGIVKTKNRSLSIPLSIEGQTDILINEALSTDNLCQMYIGWGPYL